MTPSGIETATFRFVAQCPNYMGSKIKYARRTCEIKSRIATAETAFNKKTLFTNKWLKFKDKLVKCYIWSTALLGAETWTLRKLRVNQKYHESFEIQCWKSIEKICCTDRMKTEVLHTCQGGKE